MWLKNRLYVGGGTTPQSFKDDAKLYTYAPTTDIWHTIDTPVYWFALVSYNSQLTMVGGVEHVSELGDGQTVDKLLTLCGDSQWHEILPCMNTKRHSASAASHGDHLLVAGGATVEPLDVVEVLMPGGSCWIFVKPLPFPGQSMKSVVFNDCWYLLGGQTVLYASLDSLIAGSTSCEWKTLSSAPDFHCSLAAFGNRLVVIENESVSSPSEEDTPESRSPLLDRITSEFYSSAILAYSPHNKSWVHVGDIPPTGESSTYTAVTCTSKGELIVVGSSIHFTVDLKGMLLLFAYFCINNCYCNKNYMQRHHS